MWPAPWAEKYAHGVPCQCGREIIIIYTAWLASKNDLSGREGASARLPTDFPNLQKEKKSSVHYHWAEPFRLNGLLVRSLSKPTCDMSGYAGSGTEYAWRSHVRDERACVILMHHISNIITGWWCNYGNNEISGHPQALHGSGRMQSNIDFLN